MIIPDRWVDQWIDAWNRRDMDALMRLYADDIQLRSPFSKVYAGDGTVRGKAALRAYWEEAMRRMPNLEMEKVAVYTGHMALSFVYRDHLDRLCNETVLFNDQDLATFETACLDRVR